MSSGATDASRRPKPEDKKSNPFKSVESQEAEGLGDYKAPSPPDLKAVPLVAESVQAGVGEDDFDLNNLRLAPALATPVTKTALTSVPIGKFNHQVFFQVNPSPDYQLPVALIELKEDGSEYYLVANPHLQRELLDAADETEREAARYILYTCIDRYGNVRLWPVRQPDLEARRGASTWHLSAHACAQKAMTQWVRMRANRATSSYDLKIPDGVPPPSPVWPDYTMKDLIRLAFGEQGLIKDRDHPVLKKLRGSL